MTADVYILVLSGFMDADTESLKDNMIVFSVLSVLVSFGLCIDMDILIYYSSNDITAITIFLYHNRSYKIKVVFIHAS